MAIQTWPIDGGTALTYNAAEIFCDGSVAMLVEASAAYVATTTTDGNGLPIGDHNNNEYQVGQRFIAVSSGYVGKVSIYMGSVVTTWASAALTVQIYNASGGPGTTVLGSGVITSTIAQNSTAICILDTKAQLQNGSSYWIICTVPPQAASVNYRWKVDSSGVYATGVYLVNSGNWVAYQQCAFETWTLEYDKTNPTVELKTPFSSGQTAYLSCSAVASTTGTDDVRFTISDDSGVTYYYENGGVLATSDNSYSQTSQASALSAVIGSLTASNVLFVWKAYLHSSDGATTPSLDEYVLEYTADASGPSVSNFSLTSTAPRTLNINADFSDNASNVDRAKILVATLDTLLPTGSGGQGSSITGTATWTAYYDSASGNIAAPSGTATAHYSSNVHLPGGGQVYAEIAFRDDKGNWSDFSSALGITVAGSGISAGGGQDVIGGLIQNA